MTPETTLTDEWIEAFDASVAAGENLADSIFWRLAPDFLPLGVDGDDPRVVAAIKKIKQSVEVRNEERDCH